MLNNDPVILVTPEKSLFTSELHIIIKNLPAHVAIVLSAQLQDEQGAPWFSSHAHFKTDSNGHVDLKKDAPLSGSYRGVDPMGLFWSMHPVNTSEVHASIKGNEYEVLFTVAFENKIIARKIIYRPCASEHIETHLIAKEGIVGVFCYPQKAQHLPGIITVSGSGGGLSMEMAQLLASQDYAVMALAYFGLPGLPDTLESIPLEYFQKAIFWFKQQRQVNEKKIALRGASYGGECVLLLAATFPEEFSAVVAISPPSMIFGGFPHSNKPAWTYQGTPIVPFVGGLTSDKETLTETQDILSATQQGLILFHAGTYEDPYELTPLFLLRLKKYHHLQHTAAIPVEKIQCPLLVISCEDDKVHPATEYGHLIMQRLERYDSMIERQHLHFKQAGHSLRTPYEPKVDLPWELSKGCWHLSGGSAEGNAYAAKKSFEAMLNFLDKTLRRAV